MGPLSLPTGAPIYVDANVLIYSIERIAPYTQMLDAFWQEVSTQHQPVLTSELTVLEVLVAPLKAGDTTLETAPSHGALFLARYAAGARVTAHS